MGWILPLREWALIVGVEASPLLWAKLAFPRAFPVLELPIR